jgi:hypothetical protein
MLMQDGLVYWCDYGGLTVEDMRDYDGTWVCAEGVRWRRVDEFMGGEDVFAYSKGDPDA